MTTLDSLLIQLAKLSGNTVAEERMRVEDLALLWDTSLFEEAEQCLAWLRFVQSHVDASAGTLSAAPMLSSTKTSLRSSIQS